MMLNGFPTMDARLRPMFAEHHNNTLQNFAGNGFPSTIIAAFIIAIQFCFQDSNEGDGAQFYGD
jgi:hypothetical protein